MRSSPPWVGLRFIRWGKSNGLDAKGATVATFRNVRTSNGKSKIDCKSLRCTSQRQERNASVEMTDLWGHGSREDNVITTRRNLRVVIRGLGVVG
jgi:hypothetical protein